MNLLVLFIVLNVLNVIIQTVKSIATIKCGKVVAALTNAIAYGLYTVVVVYMVCELSLWVKVAVVAGANLIGVFVVKLIEEKTRKDKLWEIRATVIEPDEKLFTKLKEMNVSYSAVKCISNDRIIINCYCKTQKDTHTVKELFKDYNAKFFVSEAKTELF